MSKSSLASMLTASLVASSSLGQQSDPELARGIRLVEQGEYSQAIIVLDTASRRLDRPQDRGLAAQAYLYLGIAHVGEGQETLARASFREALTRAPGLSLSAFDVSPKVRELFQRAKDELAPTAQAAPAKKGKSKAPLIVLGVAAAGGGLALVAGGGSASSASVASGASTNTARLVTADPAQGSAIPLSTRRTATLTFSLDVARSEGAVFCAFLDERDTVNTCFAGSCVRVGSGSGTRHVHEFPISDLARCQLPNPFSLGYDLNDDSGNKLYFQRVQAFYTILR